VNATAAGAIVEAAAAAGVKRVVLAPSACTATWSIRRPTKMRR
jgi:hypothetical protein